MSEHEDRRALMLAGRLEMVSEIEPILSRFLKQVRGSTDVKQVFRLQHEALLQVFRLVAMTMEEADLELDVLDAGSSEAKEAGEAG